MKKRFYLLGMLLSGGVALAQQDAEGRVGINTSNPVASLDISRNEALLKDAETQKQAQGVSFPNFSTEERSKFENVAVGTMIFNTDKQCLEMYFGLKGGRAHWDCIPNATSAQSQNVAIVPAGFEGVYVAGVPFTDANKVKFELQNNGFSPISNVNFASAVSISNKGGVSVSSGQNSNVSLQAGGKTTLSYTLTGTPQEGALVANFNHLGLTADQQTQVGLGSASVANKDNYTVSLYYQPTNTVVPGKINNGAEKVTIKIPYTNGKGSYNAVNINNIRTAPGQGGDVNDLSLSIPAGNFGVKGELTATIKVEGDGEYLVKQMAPGESYDIATFPIDMNGTHYNVVLKGIGGIPDRCFGKTTLECVGYGANVKEHEFIYVPIEGPDGRTWLNNNLGADYANVNSPHFNPTQQATSKTDYKAYGSMFQWGREANGHELVDWTSSTSGRVVHSNLSWSRDMSSSLTTYHDPCPQGYHTPTEQELRNLHKTIVGKSLSGANSSNSDKMWKERKLNLPAAGYRYYTSGSQFRYTGGNGSYWSSTQYGSNSAWELRFYSSDSYMNDIYRSFGQPVRCLKD
ncbi:FISUMP domain-containing protein [Ornithobacterium rhinotracheale]|uniref:FISUMP domain-containing protein n=2 Tax=Ornithobacterium rhinotracheale TaxID=28251 RepID=UPI0039FBA695